MIKNFFNSKTLFGVIFIIMVLSTVFVAIELIKAPSIAPANNLHMRIKGDYILILLQCVFGVAAMFLPSIVRKRLHLIIPSSMIIVYSLFLFCAIYLGEVQSFYYNVPNWDTILHALSGAMLGTLGFSLINFLNNTKSIPLNLSPLFVAIFAFCFAVALGVIWEVYEFSADSVLGTNMQKFALESGEQLVGRAALTDTMKDLIVDSVGAFIMSAFGYGYIKTKKGWLQEIQLTRVGE